MIVLVKQIIREGDPVPRMVFIVRGRIKRNQTLSKGMVASSVLEPGGFLGDELLSWCLRRPFIDRLPASSATFVCLESTEAFGLDANHLRYITDHFRYKFANERLKRTARYYSSNWRTWAAVNIQFAWRRYRQRTRGPVTPVRDNGGTERRLLQYAAMFMSIRPHDHLEWKSVSMFGFVFILIWELQETHSFQRTLYDWLKFKWVSLFWEWVSSNRIWDPLKFHPTIKNVLKNNVLKSMLLVLLDSRNYFLCFRSSINFCLIKSIRPLKFL